MNADDTMHIVLPFVGPRSARTAFPVARVLAGALHASVHMPATMEQEQSACDFARQLPDAERAALALEPASGGLLAAVKRRAECARQAMVILAARYGEPQPQGEAQAADAVARQVMEHIARPILLVPPERDMAGWRLRRALMPQDGTPGCAGALAQFINRSARFGVENLVLRIAGAKVDQPKEPGSLAMPRYVDHPQYEWDAWSREFLDRILGMGVHLDGSRLQLLMAAGEPAAETLRVAREKDVDMIVLPWHRATGAGRARMVKTVLQQAACPVLLLPERIAGRDNGKGGKGGKT